MPQLHPTDRELDEYLWQFLAPEHSRAVFEHLGGCGDCQARLDERPVPPIYFLGRPVTVEVYPEADAVEEWSQAILRAAAFERRLFVTGHPASQPLVLAAVERAFHLLRGREVSIGTHYLLPSQEMPVPDAQTPEILVASPCAVAFHGIRVSISIPATRSVTEVALGVQADLADDPGPPYAPVLTFPVRSRTGRFTLPNRWLYEKTS